MPSISMFAVANSALINKLMASRLVYGMARQRVVPPILGRVGEVRRTPWMAIRFTTLLALGLVFLVSFASADAVRTLGGMTALLLLGVFTVVNLAVVVLRTDRPQQDFRAPAALPIIGMITCLYLGDPDVQQDCRPVRRRGVVAAGRWRAVRHQHHDQQAARSDADQYGADRRIPQGRGMT
jgi:hypothetical protein